MDSKRKLDTSRTAGYYCTARIMPLSQSDLPFCLRVPNRPNSLSSDLTHAIGVDDIDWQPRRQRFVATLAMNRLDLGLLTTLLP